MASLGIYSAEAFQPAKIIKKINKKPWSDIIAVVSHSWCLWFFFCVCATPALPLEIWMTGTCQSMLYHLERADLHSIKALNNED